MDELYPLCFKPIFKERIWGGRSIERLYNKNIPADVPIGESWEISDRPEDASEIINGQFRGKTLTWMMQNHGPMMMGHSASLNGRFPLLVKILDAQETLSVQVHPPAEKAAILGGEPKTEMWFITEASRGASLFVGLKNGVSKDHFIESINDGTVADCLFSHHVKAGDCMFLPSGRLHAIGAGNVIFEIQQNSDTTYRVFDWNRAGLDGKPRELHIKESIESIDFEDFEPSLASFDIPSNSLPDAMRIVDHELFKVDHANWPEGFQFDLPHLDRPIILGIHRGQLAIDSNSHTVNLRPGEFVLIPASCRMIRMTAISEPAQFIVSIPQ